MCELLVALLLGSAVTCGGFEIEEATVEGIQLAFDWGELTSARLVAYYLERIRAFNPLLRAVIEVNPDALAPAYMADRERARLRGRRGALHGIRVLVMDSVETRDRLNTTAGSLALLGSVVRRDAGVVARLRAAGAVILRKASMSEWAHFRSFSVPNGRSARGGQGKANGRLANASIIFDHSTSGEEVALLAEFKLSLNAYLSALPLSPVRSLADVIDFNNIVLRKG